MKGDPEFVILKYQAWMDAAEFEDTILGAVIREPLSPSTNYVPDAPRTVATPEFQTGLATDFILAESEAPSAELAASVGKIGGFSIKGSKQESVRLAGKLIRYKRIRQLDQYWERLLENQEVKSIVPGWISLFNAWPVCLVAGIMVCEDVELSVDGAHSRQVEGHVQLPLGQITLGPQAGGNTMNPQATLAAGMQTASIFKAKMGKSNIFAVELRKVTTDMFRRKQLRLKRTGPDIDEHRLAGDDSDGDFEEGPAPGEKLILDNLTAEELEDMRI